MANNDRLADAIRQALPEQQTPGPTTWTQARDIAQRNGYSLNKTEGGDYRLAPRNLSGEAQELRAYYATDPADAIGTMRAELRTHEQQAAKVDRMAMLIGRHAEVAHSAYGRDAAGVATSTPSRPETGKTGAAMLDPAHARDAHNERDR